MATVYNQIQLCADSNTGLFSLEFKPRKFVSLSFMKLRTMERTPMFVIYEIINIRADFSVQRWGDIAYQSEMSSLLGENEWLEFKRGILHICTEQNAKRAALRALIEFNCYRSLFGMAHVYFIDYLNELHWPRFSDFFSNASWQDPLRDPPERNQGDHQCCYPPRCLLIVLLMPFIYLYLGALFCLLVCSGLLDLLLLPRFCLFVCRHVAFLESVLTSHPDLDPVLIEKEFIVRIQQLAERLPDTLRFKLHSYTRHIPQRGEYSEYYIDCFHIEFLERNRLLELIL